VMKRSRSLFGRNERAIKIKSSNVSFLPKTLRFVFIRLSANHGHGGHENGFRRGVFGGDLSNEKMSAGGHGSSSWENPCFWGLTSNVRPSDGTMRLVLEIFATCRSRLSMVYSTYIYRDECFVEKSCHITTWTKTFFTNREPLWSRQTQRHLSSRRSVIISYSLRGTFTDTPCQYHSHLHSEISSFSMFLYIFPVTICLLSSMIYIVTSGSESCEHIIFLCFRELAALRRKKITSWVRITGKPFANILFSSSAVRCEKPPFCNDKTCWTYVLPLTSTRLGIDNHVSISLDLTLTPSFSPSSCHHV
jgi:hypothetical protein